MNSKKGLKGKKHLWERFDRLKVNYGLSGGWICFVMGEYVIKKLQKSATQNIHILCFA